jgi:hypothetical protein
MEAYFNRINKEIFKMTNPNEDYVSRITFTMNPNKTEFHQLYNLNIIEQKNCYNNHSSQTRRDESFIQLPLPISLSKVDFNELFKSYFHKQRIENSFCTEIIKDTVCHKLIHSRLRLEYPPQILKRYYFKHFIQKNHVDISIEFDLLTDCFDEISYELFSIVCHSGDDLNSGHYTSFCKESDNNWYFFDDLNGVRFADLSTTDTHDYLKCSSESYVLFYVRKTDPNEPFPLEKQFSQLSVSQSSNKDEKLIFKIDENNEDKENKLPTKPQFEEIFELNTSFKNISIQQEYESFNCIDEEKDKEDDSNDEEEPEDLCGPENYQIINEIRIFFNNYPDASVSGLLCLNNILQKQIIKENELLEALHIWSDLDDIRILLRQENYFLVKKQIDRFEDLVHFQNDLTYLIDDNKHFIILKCVSKKLFLLNPIKTNPEELSNYIVNSLNGMKKRNEITFTIYEVIKIEGNSSIEINKISLNNEPHDDNYGIYSYVINILTVIINF